MSANKKKGILFGVASGLSWGFYTVLLYNVLNLYAGSTGTVDNFHGWILIITTALVIGLCDSVFGLIFECCYLIKIGQFRAKHDVVLPDGQQLDKLRSYNVALSFGYLF